MENQVNTIDEIFEISEIEKGDVNCTMLRQGCISVQTPNATTDKDVAEIEDAK